MHKHEEISKIFLCIFCNEILLFAKIRPNLLFTYTNFLQNLLKNNIFVLTFVQKNIFYLIFGGRFRNRRKRELAVLWFRLDAQKKMANERPSFWRRYFCYLLGVAKLYNVLGGGYEYYNSIGSSKSVHKVLSDWKEFLCRFIRILSVFVILSEGF